jgi:hypothetical protein
VGVQRKHRELQHYRWFEGLLRDSTADGVSPNCDDKTTTQEPVVAVMLAIILP